MSKKWNVLVDENGNVNAITTGKALRQYQRQLQQQAKSNAEAIKHLLHFVLVSDLEDVDFGEYLKDFQPIYKNEVNGINNLVTFASKVAKERGITAPCLCFVELDGKKYGLSSKYEGIIVLNAKVTVEEDYEWECYSDKGSTPFGWAHPSITEFYKKEVNEPEDYDFCLKSKCSLKGDVRCGIETESLGGGYRSYCHDEEFDTEKCVGCEFYKICNREPITGTTYYYIKAMR
ncbi:hypothetical protein IKF03_02715 [Candidatus Saccharibacteria bacterium]|nr:hypothetical protein [Candidatus Saccharibacteria bacterium]